MSFKQPSRRAWALVGLASLFVWLVLISLFLVPVAPSIDEMDSGKSVGLPHHESLIRHPMHIPAMFWETTTYPFKQSASVELWLEAVLGAFLAILPAWICYCIFRIVAYPRKIATWKRRIGTTLIYTITLVVVTSYSVIKHPWPRPTVQAAFDAFENLNETSTDLEADLNLMWQVNRPRPGYDWVTASNEAIWAAVRVFNTVELIGLPKDEAEALLKVDQRASNYGYKAPFWPVEDNTHTLRFDNGAWGWQFDLIHDEEGTIKEVKRTPIH